MIEIDGSVGEGGGQILRSSVALATITGTPIVITNIRANRKKPGLKRQHLAAINAAAEICDARTSGLELHSTTITFEPHCIRSGEYSFSIGTAGSTSLVLQTVLIPLLLGDGPSTVRLEGGTHNEWAPPFDFLEHCYVPMLVKMGADVAVRLERFGFYPAGCGRMVANIKPVDEWRSLELLDRGQLVNRQVRAISAKLPASVADRELKRIRSKTNWPKAEFVADAD
ncbi:MAG: RNA 3'-phosphate cyclase, partial [Planctomycetales bacterium]|nr:RNA 3'-phosphate cyclase [Planctomycetales bacterium]